MVYEAEHFYLDRTVALKVLSHEAISDPASELRFILEARAQAKLDHAHVLPIYDADNVDGVAFIAMKLVRGHDLSVRLRQEGPMEPRPALQHLSQIASALDAAHARGLVHRDIKPGNILVDSTALVAPGISHLYLADFGLARDLERASLTPIGAVMGTLAYMAPEQLQGQRAGTPADIYALALMLYEALTGVRPSPGLRGWDAIPPLRGPLSQLNSPLAQGLAADPARRWSTSAEMIQACAVALGMRQPGGTKEPASSTRKPFFAGRRREPRQAIAPGSARNHSQPFDFSTGMMQFHPQNSGWG